MLNLNENENQNDREPIPSGTKCVLQMRINQPEASQKSDLSIALTKSTSSDAHYLNCEFDVLSPKKYKDGNRKVFQNYTVEGGKKDSNGKSIAGRISGTFLRAAWEAANNIRPDDMSNEAVQKRHVQDYTNFDGIVFPAILAIRAAQNGYPAKNEIYQVITPDKPEFQKLMAGEEVEPANIGIIGEGKKKGGATSSAKPAWAGAAPAAAQPTAENMPFQKPAAAASAADMKPAWAR